jgi:hypothetical protein
MILFILLKFLAFYDDYNTLDENINKEGEKYGFTTH